MIPAPSGSHLKCLNVLKLKGNNFIDPKRSVQLFWTKLLPALFIKKPWYPCPFESLAEALQKYDMAVTRNALQYKHFKDCQMLSIA
jgi:hypothetical protein